MTLEPAIAQLLFYVFGLLCLLGGIGVVAFRNPVSSAMSMALCFLSVAAIFFGMGAEFLGITQIVVYAGAILVLFLFVVMMLDVKREEKSEANIGFSLVGTIVAAAFAGMVANVTLSLPGACDNPCPAIAAVDGVIGLFCPAEEACDAKEAPSAEACDKGKHEGCTHEASGVLRYGSALPALAQDAERSDTQRLGAVLFTRYNIPLAILSLALLAACVGGIALSRKIKR